MKISSPNNIEILIHCYTTPTAHPRIDAPAVIEAIGEFLESGCIVPAAGKDQYRTTPKGDAWVKLLCNVEMPREVYVDAYGNILE